MAKKKQRKKHQFKATNLGSTASSQVAQSSVETTTGTSQAVAAKPAKVTRNSQALAGVEDFSYVSVELKRVLILAVGLVALELLLWVLFRQTSVGTRVYEIIKL
jgi:branched-subunit amino acid ABC-type transport system permease component